MAWLLSQTGCGGSVNTPLTLEALALKARKRCGAQWRWAEGILERTPQRLGLRLVHVKGWEGQHWRVVIPSLEAGRCAPAVGVEPHIVWRQAKLLPVASQDPPAQPQGAGSLRRMRFRAG